MWKIICLDRYYSPEPFFEVVPEIWVEWLMATRLFSYERIPMLRVRDFFAVHG